MRPLSLFGTLAVVLHVGANPLPAPTPPPLHDGEGGPESVVGHRHTCTTTLTYMNYGFRGDWTPSVTKTVYTSTKIIYERVPCNGCLLGATTKLAPGYGGIGPVEMVVGTTTAAEPFTTTTVICSAEMVAGGRIPLEGKEQTPTTSPSHMPPSPPPSTSKTATPSSTSRSEDCTTTRMVPLKPTMGPVKTVWTTTETATSHVDCGGCRFVASLTRDFLNPGPVVIFSTTTTETSASAATTFVCLKTPSVVAGSPSYTLPVVQPSG